MPGPLRFWQKRYWDHVIHDEEDFRRHLDYIHYSLVKHSYVSHPEDWPHSSFVFWKDRGAYPEHWGWALSNPPHDVTGHLPIEDDLGAPE